MFGLFKTNPIKKLRKQYDQKLARAMQAQQEGNIQDYAKYNSEAEALFEEIEEFEMNYK
ncbi:MULTISPECIES: DUF6435 family protein [Aliiglaciecola]|uniref:DUF6435 family protein n=1 Tax=Aliiglaciecola TaxID=1406885 RepID=UPI001C09EAB6|nr:MULTISPECIES: DUF6435 family protein [Aliiglaciecola]MBU2879615.1 Lacal_2735 family protein [Aliiglaciecola lipolytica]MDO6710105.1 DUF6435 family protein [Aliiglaciecola sp. 2_MG-2023]MDO6751253.1 DUF6435 family protein [Aliiglaciecola sp. 1_MG-2023]